MSNEENVVKTEGTKSSRNFADPKDLVIIGLDTDDGPSHMLYDNRNKIPVDEALARSIGKFGVMEKVKVRKDGNDLVVVSGRQRTRAARWWNKFAIENNLKTVRVPYEFEFVSMEEGGRRNRVSNAYRTDEPTWMKAQTVIDCYKNGESEEDLAEDMKVSVQQIKVWMQWALIHPKVQDAVRANKFAFNSAILLASLTAVVQEEALVEMYNLEERGEAITGKVVRVIVANLKAKHSITTQDAEAMEDEALPSEDVKLEELGAPANVEVSREAAKKNLNTALVVKTKRTAKTEPTEPRRKYNPPGRVEMRKLTAYFDENRTSFPELASFFDAYRVTIGDLCLRDIDGMERLVKSMAREQEKPQPKAKKSIAVEATADVAATDAVVLAQAADAEAEAAAAAEVAASE